jgi:hypothetical protein
LLSHDLITFVWVCSANPSNALPSSWSDASIDPVYQRIASLSRWRCAAALVCAPKTRPRKSGGSIVKRTKAILSTSLIAATFALGLSATPASAAPAASNYPCGTTAHDIDAVTPTEVIEFVPSPTINIRTGTSSQCSIIGNIGKGEAFNYDCYVVDAINRTWTFLHTSENEYGWVLDSALLDNGSPIECTPGALIIPS